MRDEGQDPAPEIGILGIPKEAPQDPSSSEPAPDPKPPAPEPAEPPPVAPDPKPAKGPRGRKAEGSDSVAEFVERLGQVEGQASVTVQRKKRGGAVGYCFRTDVESFSMEELKAEYGGGSYRLTVRDEDERKVFEQSVDIVGKPKDPAVADASGPTGDSSMLSIIEGIRRDMERGFDRLRNPTPQAEAQNPLDTALAIAEFFQKAQAPYMEALAAKKDKGADPAEYINLLLQGMELGKNLNPPADPLTAVAANVAGPLLSLLQGRVNQEAPAVNPNPAETVVPATDARRPTWDVFLSPWMPTLQGWAAKGKDPLMRAEFVADEIPEDALQLFGEQLERGDMFLAEFFTLHPETKPLEGWYREFWSGLKESIVWEEEPQAVEVGTHPPAVEVGTHPPAEEEPEGEPEGEKEGAA